MCGRFTQNYTWSEVHDFLNVLGTPRNLRPRYNIGPTTPVDVVRLGPARNRTIGRQPIHRPIVVNALLNRRA